MTTRRISQLRNLGPACERDLNAVEIHTLADIKRVGIERVFVRLMEGRIVRGERPICFNACYLYALYGAVHDCDWRDVPETKKRAFKRLTASLREKYSGFARKPRG